MISMNDFQTPCGKAIEDKRLALGLSIRKAAKEAGISDGRLRQVEKGYANAGGGIRVPVNPSERLLRTIARVLGLDGDVLVALNAEHSAGTPEPDDRDSAHAAFVALIQADPSLDALSKAHIINQHTLLQRGSATEAANRAQLDREGRAEIEAAIKATRKRPTPKSK